MVSKSIPKINAQIGNGKKIKVIKSNVFLNGKIIQIHCKNCGFEGFPGCVRERKSINNTSTNIQQIIFKSMKTMQNPCSKNDATNIGNHQKWTSKGNEQTSKNLSEIDSKKYRKT